MYLYVGVADHDRESFLQLGRLDVEQVQKLVDLVRCIVIFIYVVDERRVFIFWTWHEVLADLSGISGPLLVETTVKGSEMIFLEAIIFSTKERSLEIAIVVLQESTRA